jgi:crotonobetainyl-CoA:carnitine CoA-transferase CaiB-like acyl-CoA transferase
MDALIQSWIGEHTIAACVRGFAAAGIPCGPIAPVEGSPREANLDHRAMIRQATDGAGRTVHVAGSPFRMSRLSGLAPAALSAADADRALIIELLHARGMTDAPPELTEVIWSKPGICPSCRSNGAVTVAVITSGLAPGYRVFT